MNALVYALGNGTIVKTVEEAKASGMAYKPMIVPIKEEVFIPKKHKEILAEVGVVR